VIPAILAALLIVPDPLTRLVGSWHCSTAGGSIGAASFSVSRGDLREHEDWKSANATSGGTWNQQFVYDTATRSWKAKNVGSNGWVFQGWSQGFTGGVVAFVGTQNEGTQTVRERERYLFESANRFAHAWDVKVGDLWRPTSYAECTRY
jgi:hypothetical protein